MKQQRERLVDAARDGTCPTCERPLGDHYRTVLDSLDEQIESLDRRRQYFRVRIEQLDEMPAEVRALDERRRAALRDDRRSSRRRFAKVQAAVQELAHARRATSRRKRAAARGRCARPRAIAVGYDAARHARRAPQRRAADAARRARDAARRRSSSGEPQLGARARARAPRPVASSRRGSRS